MIIGYARVSTDEQDTALQVESLKAAGAGQVFAENASGAKSERPELKRAISLLKAGDTLLVTRLDRLARSTRDLLNLLHQLGSRQVGFKSLADAWADTGTPHGRLMLTVLGGLAEFERELIKARTGEGRNRAIARGVKFGRPRKLKEYDRRAIKHSPETNYALAKTFGLHPTTIGRIRKS